MQIRAKGVLGHVKEFQEEVTAKHKHIYSTAWRQLNKHTRVTCVRNMCGTRIHMCVRDILFAHVHPI